MQKAFNNLEQNIKYFISSSMANQTSMTEGKAKVEAYYADNWEKIKGNITKNYRYLSEKPK